MPRCLLTERSRNFNRKPPSSSRRNSRLRKSRKVGSPPPSLLISFSTALSSHLRLLRLVSTSIPSKNTAPCLRLNPEQISDICSLSVSLCLIPLYFPSRHRALSRVIGTYRSDCCWLTVGTISRVQILAGARTLDQTMHSVLQRQPGWCFLLRFELGRFSGFETSEN